MRKFLLVGTVALSLGAVTAANLFVHAGAQPVPPPAAGGPALGGGWGMGMHHPGGPRWEHPAMDRMRTFALIYRPDDRHLTPSDVQKIAEAFLLWNGNHTWKVTNVAAGKDTVINFDITAPDGTLIARFEMDSKTGHVTRLG